MSENVLFLVRATGHKRRAIAVVWIGWRTPQGLQVWRWEVLRVLWESMGTATTAAWVAEQFGQDKTEGRVRPPLAVEVLGRQIQQAFDEVERTWPLPG